MGSGCGYEFHYRFWMDDDIIHRYSCFNIRDDIKFLFKMRTNFKLKGKDCCDEIIDTERFEMGAEDSFPALINLQTMETDMFDSVPCSSIAVDSVLRISSAGVIWGSCCGPFDAKQLGLSGFSRASYIAKTVGKCGFSCGY